MEARKKHPLRGIIILLIATVIWGLAYIAQSDAMQHLGPIAFNCIRITLGGLVLIPAIPVFHHFDPEYRLLDLNQRRKKRNISLIGGVVCGAFLCAAAAFQQIGISTTSAGKSGFLTALYIVLVPIFGILFRKRASWIALAGVLLALIGSYFLCVKQGTSFTIEQGDWMLMLDAVMFAFQILFIDFFLERGGDSIWMTCVEFLFAGVIQIPYMLIAEPASWSAILAAGPAILYAGLASGAVGYTLQMLGQRELEPTGASLLMSLESVFAALFGWLLLGQQMSGRELIGCGLVFAAVIISQIPMKKRSR